MSFTYVFQSDLDAAVAQKIITQDQATALWPFLQQEDNDRWRIGWSRLAYVIGGFLIIGSLTWFTSLVWEQHTLALFWLTLFYIASFGFAGNYFWKLGQGWQQIVGGVFVTVAVCITPASVYALEKYYNFFTPVTPGVLPATGLAVASIIALVAVPFTFLTAPLSFALYYISMQDIPPLIWGGYSSLEEQSWVSVVFGVAMIAGYRLVDALKPKYDYSFWGYLFGVASLVGGLTSLDTYVYTSWEFKLAYFFINLAIAASGNLLNRVVFVIFGGFGVTFATVDFFVTYATVEQDAWLSVTFGFVLMTIGFVIQSRNTVSGMPYWFYLIGVPIFWFGWATLFGWPIYVSFGFRFLFFLVNLGLLLGLIYTKERIFLFFGGAGILWYVEALAELYPNAWWLPLVITLLGLGFIALAVYYSGKGVAALVQRIKQQRIVEKARKKAADIESEPINGDSNQTEMEAMPVATSQPMVLQQLPMMDMQGQPMMLVNYVPMGSYDPSSSMYVPMVPAAEHKTDSA